MASDSYRPDDLTTVSFRKRSLVMFPVQKKELDDLAAGYSSIHTGLFGCFVGVLCTLIVALATTPLPEPMARRFWDGLYFFAAASLYCGLMAIRDYWNSRNVLATIRSETVDVVVKSGTDLP